MDLKTLLAIPLAALAFACAQGIVLEDATGTVELDEPATRVVALEWTYAEDLLALGVQPVGMADIANYGTWVNAGPAVGADVVDVGTRQEPSLETILSLEPDLIIGVAFRHEPILDELRAIAPTLLFDNYPAEGAGSQYREMEDTFRTVGRAVGREAEAEAVLDEVEATYERLETRLEESGEAGRDVLLVQAYSYQNSPQIRVFTDNALAVGVMERIGLENAWPNEYAQYGFDTVEPEGLAPVADADAFIYIVQQDDDVFAGALAENPLWQNLGFVEAGRTFGLPGNTWPFGGPRSAELLALRITDALTE